MSTHSRVVFVIFVVGCLVKVICSVASADCQCGRAAKTPVAMRIVGGRRAAPHSLPWLVAILLNGEMHCGGSVITNVHILSAGHCVQWSDYRKMTVLLGLDTVSDMRNVQKRRIDHSVIHENFTSTKVRDENDIAIFTLDRPVEFGDTVIPICLPERGQDFSGYMAVIAGWGRLGENQAASKILLKTSQKILSEEECLKTKLSLHLKPTMICGYLKGHDGCQGDSGGALMVIDTKGRYIQAGVTSWGIGCADPRYPGVYTKVSDYVDWIKKNTDDGKVCRK